MLEIIKTIAVSIIIPATGILIAKYIDAKFNKELKQLKSDIADIKHELQIGSEIDKQINRLEQISLYCLSKYSLDKYKNVFAEKNRKFIEAVVKIARNDMLKIEYFDDIVNIFDAGYLYCENYLKLTLPEEFTNEFLKVHKMHYKLFLRLIEEIIFSNTNQRTVKFFDACNKFLREYNQRSIDLIKKGSNM